MRIRFGACLAIFAATFIMSPPVAAEKPVAILLSCRGAADVSRSGGQSQPGSFGLPLYEGDEVQTGEDSEAEIHFENGTWIIIGSRSRMQVKAQPQAGRSARPEKESRSFESVQEFIKLKNYKGSSSMVGLRSGEKCRDLRPIAPCDTRIRTMRPLFQWSCSDSTKKLRVVLYNEEAVQWEQKVPAGTSLRYPEEAPPLAPGTVYSWAVETADPLVFPPIRSQAAFFEILSPEEERDLALALKSLEKEEIPSVLALHFVRASLFFDAGCVNEAIAETRTALEKDPDNATLHSILAHLYAEGGRPVEALGEYKHLLEKR